MGSNLAESFADLLLPRSQHPGERGGHSSPSASAASLLHPLDSGATPAQRKSLLHSIFLTFVFYIFILWLFRFPFDSISLVSFSVTESPSP